MIPAGHYPSAFAATGHEEHNREEQNKGSYPSTCPTISAPNSATYEQKRLSEQSVEAVQGRSPFLSAATAKTVDFIQLPDGQKLPDYRGCEDFSKIMEAMTPGEAHELSELIKKYPDQFPMPGMVKIAGMIHAKIDEILKATHLNDGEKAVFRNLKEKLQTLSPDFPYKKTFVFIYRFLHCKSFIEYQQQVELELGRKKKCKSEGEDDKATDRTTDSTGEKWGVDEDSFKFIPLSDGTGNIFRLATYNPESTTVQTIDELPWDEIFTDPDQFKKELCAIYHSRVIQELSYSALDALDHGYPLIPFADELDINYFNKTITHPLFLTGFSLDETTKADGHDMSSASFFEHDMFHSSMLIKRRCYDKAANELLHQGIQKLYNCQSSVKSVPFKAIELALFYTLHELAYTGPFFDLEKDQLDLSDLPEGYETITIREKIKAAKWLRTVWHCLENNEPEKELLKCIQRADIEQAPNQYDQKISPEFKQSLQEHSDLLQRVDIRYEKLIEAINFYEKELLNKKKKCEDFDVQSFFFHTHSYEENCWLACYFELPNTMSQTARIAQACENYRVYKQREDDILKKLRKVSLSSLEAFFNHIIKNAPIRLRMTSLEDLIKGIYMNKDLPCAYSRFLALRSDGNSQLLESVTDHKEKDKNTRHGFMFRKVGLESMRMKYYAEYPKTVPSGFYIVT